MRIKLIALTAFVLFAHVLHAQNKHSIDQVEVLDVTDRLWVTIIPSDQNKLEIEGELADKVETVFSGNELRLKMKAGYYLKGNQASIILFSNQISKIIARKGSEVNVEKDSLKADEISFTANQGAKIRALISASTTHIIVNTGASIDLLGKSDHISINTTAGASFFGKDLKTKSAIARVNAGGRVQVNASQSADVETRLGGVIEVYGNPAQQKEHKIAGGNITFFKDSQ